jgi:glucose-6-phosphate 1-dehydrogenase
MYKLIIIGATSDICRNKVYKNINNLHPFSSIYCYGWEKWTNNELCNYFNDYVKGDISNLLNKINFINGNYNDYKTTLSNIIDNDTVIYVATPPLCYKKILQDLYDNKSNFKIIFEKPFATDYKNYCDLMEYITDKVYLMDHFLYKKDIMNILSKYQDVEINTFKVHFLYSDDVEKRLGYFDKTGLFKDMFQCHYLSILTVLIGNDIEKLLTAKIIRNERKQYLNYGGKNKVDTYFYLEIDVSGKIFVFESGKAFKDKREIVINNESHIIKSYEDEYIQMFKNVLTNNHNNIVKYQNLFWKIYNRFEKSFEGCDSDYYNKYIKETDKLHHLE